MAKNDNNLDLNIQEILQTLKSFNNNIQNNIKEVKEQIIQLQRKWEDDKKEYMRQ